MVLFISESEPLALKVLRAGDRVIALNLFMGATAMDVPFSWFLPGHVDGRYAAGHLHCENGQVQSTALLVLQGMFPSPWMLPSGFLVRWVKAFHRTPESILARRGTKVWLVQASESLAAHPPGCAPIRPEKSLVLVHIFPTFLSDILVQ